MIAVREAPQYRASRFLIGALTLGLATMSLLAAGLPAQDTGSSLPTSILDGVFTAEQAFQGRQQFQRACASCHAIADHAGRKFAARWEGTTLGDLFELVSTTMPDGDPGSLKPQEYADILAFFLKESGYKEGEKDLPSDVEALKKMRIEPLAR